MAEHKLLGILLAVGLCLIAGVFALIDTEDATTKDTLGMTVAVAPPAAPEHGKTTGPGPVMGTKLPSTSPLAGKVLISKQPVKVLAEPTPGRRNSTVSRGRPFRAVGTQGDYIRIQDVKSGAGGWIEKAALAPAPAQTRTVNTAPVAPPPSAAPTTTRRTAAPVTEATPPPKQTAPSRTTSSRTASSSTDAEPRKKKPGGLFGGNGPFRGLFGNNR